MAHKIVFTDFHKFTLLTQAQIRDIIEMFYRGGDTNFEIVAGNPEKGSQLANARYEAFSNTHTITISEKRIVKHCADGYAGGDLLAPNIKIAAASILVHELQHSNQNLLHKGNGLFYGRLGGTNAKGQPRMKHYRGRACEREARAYADEKMNEICAYFGHPPVARRAENKTEDHAELDAVIDLLSEIESPTMNDIKDELRASGLLRPNNVMIVKKELAELGVLLA